MTAVVGFADTSVAEVMRVAEMCNKRGRRVGSMLFSVKPQQWDKPPGLFLTTRLTTLKSVLKKSRPPRRVAVFDSWLVMHGSGLHVVDADPSSSDPLIRSSKRLTKREIAKALFRMREPSLAPVPDLAKTMFTDVDGSLTQTLLKLMADVKSSSARSRIKSTYVDWLLSSGRLTDTQSLSDAGASDSALSDALSWLRSDQGMEARRVCARLGRLIEKQNKIDYTKLTAGTHVAPFDLRYLVAAVTPV